MHSILHVFDPTHSAAYPYLTYFIYIYIYIVGDGDNSDEQHTTLTQLLERTRKPLFIFIYNMLHYIYIVQFNIICSQNIILDLNKYIEYRYVMHVLYIERIWVGAASI